MILIIDKLFEKMYIDKDFSYRNNMDNTQINGKQIDRKIHTINMDGY